MTTTSANTSRRSQIVQLVVLLVVTLSALAFGLSRCGNFATEDPDRFIVSEYGKRLLVIDYSGNVKQTFDVDIRDASWSPDGQQIAVVDQQNNFGILDIGSGKIMPLTVGIVAADTIYLRWSPDSRFLAFLNQPQSTHGTISLIQLTEPPTVTLTQSCEHECGNPNWLPTGDGLIYAENLGSQGDHLAAQVRKIDIETGEVHTLFSVAHDISGMRINSDGTRLILVAHGNGGAYSLSDLSGHEEHLSLSASSDVCWVQDGNNLALTGWSHGPTFATFIYNIERKTIRQLYPPQTILPIFEERSADFFMIDCR